MPTYTYRCLKCSQQFLVEARMQDAAPTAAPGCSLNECRIQKVMTPVQGWVKGSSPAPRAPAPTTAKAPAVAADDPVHLCSKYCDHHKI